VTGRISVGLESLQRNFWEDYRAYAISRYSSPSNFLDFFRNLGASP